MPGGIPLGSGHFELAFPCSAIEEVPGQKEPDAPSGLIGGCPRRGGSDHLHLRTFVGMSNFAAESEGRQIGGFRSANLGVLGAQGRHLCQQIGALFQRPVNELFHGFLHAVGQRQTGKLNNANRRGGQNAHALGQGYLGVSFLGERLFEVESGLGGQLARSGYVRRSRQAVLETLFRSFLDL